MRSLRLMLPALALSVAGCASTPIDPGYPDWQRRPARTEAATSVAEDSPARAAFDFAELERLALANSPAVKAADDRVAAALEGVPQASALPDPTLSYAYFVEPVETRLGPQRHRVGLSQRFPLFGKRGLRGEIAQHAANAEAARARRVRFDLRRRLGRLWSDYYYLGRAIEVTDANLRLVSDLEEVALTQYSVGRTSHAAALRAQVELGRLEDRLRSLRDGRRPLLAALNAELGRAPDAPLDWPDTLATELQSDDEAALREALLASNARLLERRALAARADAEARLAGKSSLPDLVLGAEYIEVGERAGDVEDNGRDAAMALARIDLPLWFGSDAAERRGAAAKRAAAASELRDLELRVISDFERALFALRDAERQVELYAFTLLPRARQSLEVTEEAFVSGAADFLALIDAQRTLLEFELAHERALADRAAHALALDALVGREHPSIRPGGQP